jgi:hypothetical protein
MRYLQIIKLLSAAGCEPLIADPFVGGEGEGEVRLECSPVGSLDEADWQRVANQQRDPCRGYVAALCKCDDASSELCRRQPDDYCVTECDCRAFEEIQTDIDVSSCLRALYLEDFSADASMCDSDHLFDRSTRLTARCSGSENEPTTSTEGERMRLGSTDASRRIRSSAYALTCAVRPLEGQMFLFPDTCIPHDFDRCNLCENDEVSP